MSVSIEILSENYTLDFSVPDVKWNFLGIATNIFDIVGLCFMLLGFLLNYFCYITGNHLPESSSATLMKYVAVWDSISLFKIGVLGSGMTAIGLQWELYSVSLRSNLIKKAT